MANDTDFLALYQQLGLAPGGSLDDFRRAYRRRVARLHPDRTGGSGELELQALNAAYAAAMDFHARYGRLPGSVPAASCPAPRSSSSGAPAPARPARPHFASWLLALAIVALATWWLAESQLEDTATEEDHGAGTTLAATRGQAGAPARLHLGMSDAEALALQGEPVSRGASLWQWGPSWIAFECGAVSDWYSSRLRPLKVATTEPTERDRRLAPPRSRCPATAAGATR